PEGEAPAGPVVPAANQKAAARPAPRPPVPRAHRRRRVRPATSVERRISSRTGAPSPAGRRTPRKIRTRKPRRSDYSTHTLRRRVRLTTFFVSLDLAWCPSLLRGGLGGGLGRSLATRSDAACGSPPFLSRLTLLGVSPPCG